MALMAEMREKNAPPDEREWGALLSSLTARWEGISASFLSIVQEIQKKRSALVIVILAC
jgi:hypothetical protein